MDDDNRFVFSLRYYKVQTVGELLLFNFNLPIGILFIYERRSTKSPFVRAVPRYRFNLRKITKRLFTEMLYRTKNRDRLIGN